MGRIRTLAGILLLWGAIDGGPATAQSEAVVPAALEPWRQWALDQQDFLACPPRLNADWGQRSTHVCHWPDTLQLDVGRNGADFSMQWIVRQPGWVPLPGGTSSWPDGVQVDGQPMAVIGQNGGPSLYLTPGRYRVSGRLGWSERPERLRLPAAFGLLALTVDGEPVAVPLRENGTVRLGTTPRADSPTMAEDRLTLRVARLLEDRIPSRLTTALNLEVAGQERQIRLPRALLDGFTVTAIDSPLPARLAPDGTLVIQARTGSFQIRVAGRATTQVEQLDAPETFPGYAEELWQVRRYPRLRRVTIEGGQPVDPQQVTAAVSDWRGLPARLMRPGDSLSLAVEGRGLDGSRSNRLRLQQDLWLDFSGNHWLARDLIQGQMQTDWRLNSQPPWGLAAVTDRERDQARILTTDPDSGAVGVEIRDPTPLLAASLWRPASLAAVPVSGWDQAFESVSSRLHLPDGYRLLAAVGDDAGQHSGAWLDQWNLLDMFLALLVAVLAWYAFGLRGTLLAAGLMLLAWHEPRLPVFWLAAALVMTLILRLLTVSVWHQRARLVNGVFLVILGLGTAYFAASQITLAFYPQLDNHGWLRTQPWNTTSLVGKEARQDAEIALEAEALQQDRVTVTGSRITQDAVANAPPPPTEAEPAPRITADIDLTPDDSVAAAGPGIPGWRGRVHQLEWNGPVSPERELRLLITPPWLTALWRLTSVLLLAALLALLLGLKADRLRRLIPASRTGLLPMAWPLLVSALLIGGLTLGSPAANAQTPDPALLEELAERLSRPPPCGTDCAELAAAGVVMEDRRATLLLTWHVVEEVAVGLPYLSQGEGSLSQVQGRDGPLPVTGLAPPRVILPAGIHTLRQQLELGLADRYELRFPSPPRRLRVEAPDWNVFGVERGILLEDSLSMQRRQPLGEAPAAATESAPEPVQAGTTSSEIPAFARLERHFLIDQPARIENTLTRLAPERGSVNVVVEPVPGEVVTSKRVSHDGDQVIATLTDTRSSLQWRSDWSPDDTLELTAPALERGGEGRIEVWRFSVNPAWQLEFDGVPPIAPASGSTFWTWEFHPLPGEQLRVSVTRLLPDQGVGLPDQTGDLLQGVAVDRQSVVEQIADDGRDLHLDASVRATRALELPLTVPAGSELLQVQINGNRQNISIQDDRLLLSISPGLQTVQVGLRLSDDPADDDGELDDTGLSFATASSPLQWQAPAANLQHRLQLPRDRWVLLTYGEGRGPAVLYWSVLLVLILIAWALARWGITPLRFHHWLLLGLGFSTVSLTAYAVVIGWLHLLAWRRRAATDSRWFNLRQMLLLGVSALALLVIVVTIPQGLLGRPDMFVAHPAGPPLTWLLDASAGASPKVGVLSLPLWVYQVAILAWALWLSIALAGWLRWALDCLREGGFWQGGKHRSPKAEKPEG